MMLDYPMYLIAKITPAEVGEKVSIYSWSDSQELIEKEWLALLNRYEYEIKSGKIRFEIYKNH